MHTPNLLHGLGTRLTIEQGPGALHVQYILATWTDVKGEAMRLPPNILRTHRGGWHMLAC